jgi:hypothetical protein
MSCNERTSSWIIRIIAMIILDEFSDDDRGDYNDV